MKNKKDLIAQISKNLNVAQEPEAPTGLLEPTAKPAPVSAEGTSRSPNTCTTISPVSLPDSPTPGTSKQATFWLDDTDRKILQELAMLLYSQGVKPSDNLVMRAALRLVPRDHVLVEKVKKLKETDGRTLRHTKH